MATSLPYVSFPGNAATVLEYWQDVFGGTLNALRYDDMPGADFPFTPPPGAVAHAVLSGGELDVCGGDDLSTDSDPSIASERYAFSVEFDDVERARVVSERLIADGGASVVAFEMAPWGAWYGQARDRFGAAFHISVDPAGTTPQREA